MNNLDPDRIIALSHVPKTAGLTLGYLLQRHFGCRHMVVEFRDKSAWNAYSPRDLRKDLRVQPFARSIVGHALKPYVDFQEFNDRLHWYTVLRDPVSRYISHYQHEVEKGGKTIGFSEWMTTYSRRNWQVRMFAGEEDLDAAKQILVERFKCVGLQEHFHESLLLIRERLGLVNFSVAYDKPVNTAKSGGFRRKILDNIDQFRDQIEENNSLDIALYQFVRKSIWDQQMSDYGLENMKQDLRTEFETFEDCLQYNIRIAGYKAYRAMIYRPHLLLDRKLLLR